MHFPSYAQRRLWFIDQAIGPSPLYNVPFAFQIAGALDKDALAAALSDLVRRHDALRTVFHQVDGDVQAGPVDVEAMAPLLAVLKVSDADLESATLAEARRPFDLTAGLPIRANLFELESGECRLLLVFHHVAIDEWSARVLLQELSIAYRARLKNEQPLLAPLLVSYADFAARQRELLGDPADDATSVAAKDLAYWRDRLADLPEQLDLPYDRTFSATAVHAKDIVRFSIGPEIHGRLVALAASTNSFTSMVVQAALAAWLACLGAGTDVPLGMVYAQRDDEELENVVGPFINTLVLRNDLSGDPTFEEVVEQARQSTLAAFEHAAVPFDLVLESVDTARWLNRNPMFQVMYTWATLGEGRVDLTLEGLKVGAVPIGNGLAKFDLALDLAERRNAGRPAGIEGELSFDESLFDRRTAESLATTFTAFLEQVTQVSGRRLSEIDLLTTHERQLVLRTWNDTAITLDDTDLPTMFGEQVRRSPDAVAVESEDETLTYAELNARANRLAHLLIQRGAGPEAVVAVIVPRAAALLAMLAVLKAGATFLPIDPAYPTDRVRYILDDAEPALMLTVRELEADLSDHKPLVLDRPDTVAALDQCSTADPITGDRLAPLSADSPAYIIYTSGSTGQPKGVVVTARVLINLLSWQSTVMGCTSGTRVSQFSAISFDAFEEEILAALFNGQTVVIPSEDTRRDPAALVSWLQEREVNEFLAPDTVVRSVTDEAVERGTQLPHLRTLLQGGEPFQLTALLREFAKRHPELVVWNHYGPSETHVVTGLKLPPSPDAWPDVAPIGTPIWNCQTYVLDARLRPVPVGVAGELYIAGAQLARGYLGRPGLTAERFVANPFGAPGSRMYRTGDIVRWNHRGQILFIGRADDQVKIRGIRVELNEINSVLRRHPDVAQVATAVREDGVGSKKLISYIVPATPGDFDAATMRRHAAALLPAAIVPSAFVALDSLPMNSNGKLDRLALPSPAPGAPPASSPPERVTPLEEAIRTVFCDVLEVSTLSVDDSFFTLGGHSMLAIAVVKRIRTELGVELDIKTLFENPTVTGLAAVVGTRGTRPGSAPTPMPRPERVPLSFAQQRLWFIDQLEGPSSLYNLPLLQLRMTGPLDPAAFGAALTDVVVRHEILRTIFPTARGVPFQKVVTAESAPAIMTYSQTTEKDLADRLRRARRYEFDLSAELPIRAELFRLAPDEHVLLLMAHHIVVDGLSIAPLCRDLAKAYAARREGRRPNFAPLPLQYADFALWQREALGHEDDAESILAKQASAWRQILADMPEAAELPADRPRPEEMSSRGASVSFAVDTNLFTRIRSLARAEGATTFMVLHCAVAALLTRSGAGSDIQMGATVGGRSDASLDDLIGCFLNMVVLRTDTSGDPTFRQLLKRVRNADLEAFQNQDLPFDRLVKIIRPKRTHARHPLFQVMIAMQSGGQGLTLPGIEVHNLIVDSTSTLIYDLTFAFEERPETQSLSATVHYSSDLFDRTTIETLAERLVAFLDAGTSRPDTRIGDLGLGTNPS